MTKSEPLREQFDVFRDRFDRASREVSKLVLGQSAAVEGLLLALVCRGHVLVEGVPGLGKTLLVDALSRVLSLKLARIQCTPDLMPADITGTAMLLDATSGAQALEFRKGPIFAQVILVDEINRASPKTQSAFLEAMQEKQVTVLGETHPLEEPFFLVATQNPIELEGTYPLPEAQLDRFFFKIDVALPGIEALSEILALTTGEALPTLETIAGEREVREMAALVRKVKAASDVLRFAVRLMWATHPASPEAPETVRKYVRLGASPRGAQSLLLAAKALALSRGRFNVSYDDLRHVALPALSHRVLLGFEAGADGVAPSRLIEDVLAGVSP